jgi:hypothetical protein
MGLMYSEKRRVGVAVDMLLVEARSVCQALDEI